MVDTHDRDKWIELGETRAWNWQQGCMLQWLPGSKNEVIWNDRQDNQFVCHVMDVQSRKKRTLPGPIYAISPDSKWAVAPDFSRLNDCRPGYGYAGIPDRNFDVLAPKDAGIWKMDLKTGKRDLIIPFSEAARVPYKKDLQGLEELVQSPACLARRISFHISSPMAREEQARRSFRDAPLHRKSCRLRLVRAGSSWQNVAFHLERRHTCNRLGLASIARRQILHLPGQDGRSRSCGAGCYD